MIIKSLSIFPLLALTLGLASYFFAPLALAESDNFGTNHWREYRNHCTWKSGRFGVKYRSCAAQYRACSQFTGYGKDRRILPQKCGDWHNRF